MARNLTAGMLSGIASERAYPIMLVEAEFSSGFLRVWSGIGNLSWNSQTWTGVGSLGSVSPLPENSTLQAQGVTLVLSGLDSSVLPKVLDEIRHGKLCTIYFGLTDDSGIVIVDPYMSFSGRIDTGKTTDDGHTAAVSITVESRLIDFTRNLERRYTHEDQAIDFPGDLGFEYVPGLQQWNGAAGVSGSSAGGGVGPAGGGSGGGTPIDPVRFV